MTRTPNRRMHLDRSSLESFLSGELEEPESGRVEGHLRSGCTTCLFSAREVALELTGASRDALEKGFFGDPEAVEELTRYSTWVSRKVLLVELEKEAVPSLVGQLMLRPVQARRETVRETRRYQILALSEHLREESRREGFRDVARAVELAELAVEVSDCLDTQFYGARLVADTRALAYGMLGNAHRVSGDLFRAERQLRAALDLLHFGTGGSTERAQLLSLLASLRTDQGRLRGAVQLLHEASSVYRNQDLRESEARALIQMARAAGVGGEPEHAIDLLERAVELLDPERDARMAFLAHHNIPPFLSAAGRHAEAREYLQRITPLYERFVDDRGMQLRKRWTEGLIAAGLGEIDEAVAALGEVRAVFIEEERAFDNALITLDLAAVYLDAGRTAEVERLAEELYPVFRSQDVHRQALAALVLFKQAALTEAATVGLTREVADYLNRARNNPYLPFERPGN